MSEDLQRERPDSEERVIEQEQMKPGLFSEIFANPINLLLISVCVYLLYRILRTEEPTPVDNIQQTPLLMEKRDFTVQELRKYDGTNDGKILVAVNGKVFDVTKGKRFYGPGNSYGVMAGRDASRSFGKFSIDESLFKDEYDDISDLQPVEMDAIRDWEKQFEEKYDYVGKLLKPGEEHSTYEQPEENKEL